MMNIYDTLGRLSIYICTTPYIPEGIKHLLVTPVLRLQQLIRPIPDDEE